MPSHVQGTVEPPDTNRALNANSSKLSTSDTKSLKEIFSQSPILSGEMTRDSIREKFQSEVLDAVINDGGHTFGQFNTSYDGGADAAPDLNEVEAGGEGKPASAYVPNPMSAPNADPKQQPAAPDGFSDAVQSTPPFSGQGSQVNPKTASGALAGTKLGDYVMGKSPASSNEG